MTDKPQTLAEVVKLPEVAELVRRAQAISDIAYDENPFRSADFHHEDCGCRRCAMDWLAAALAKIGGAA